MVITKKIQGHISVPACPSTLKDLKEELKRHPPKRAMFKVDRKRGGVLNATCAGDLPRNALQATRIKCKMATVKHPNASDPLQALVVKFKEINGSPSQFIQSIRLVPDPVIVLFNQVQLNDLEQFCTSQDKASVLGIDVTFNLGRFYVTMCSYQNFKIVNERGKHPIMIGPTVIHSSKEQSNFTVLFQEIVHRKPPLASSLRAYGTDGEQALSNAAAEAFPFAVHLRCVNHLRDNMTAHLHKQLLPEDVIKEVLKDVFGTCTETGLIHASIKEFDAKLQLLKNRWDLLEKPYKTCPVVFRWFKLHVSPIIRENVRSELLRDLGMEEEKYTQNNSESLNALVKRYVNFQKQDILQFVNDLEECVLEQQNEVSKAAIGLGRWSLTSRYSHISQNANNWFSSMSQTEKENTLSSLRAAESRDERTLPSVSRGGVANQGTSPFVTHADVANEGKLSVPLTLVGDVFSGVLSDGQLYTSYVDEGIQFVV